MSVMPPLLDKSPMRLMLIYFVQALAAGSFLTRIPDIQRALSIDAAGLGLVLFGQTAGGILFLPLASAVVERAGTRRAVLAGLPVLALATALVGVTSSPLVAFAALAIYGATFAVTNVAMNVEADRVETAADIRIMNTCHGMGSAGLLLASAIGVGARGLGVPHALHLAAIVPLVLVATALWVWPLRAAPARSAEGQGGGPKGLPLGTVTWLLVSVILAAFVLEGTARHWSIIYMRDAFEVAEWIEALALTAFLVGMAAGRLLGDRLAGRFGPVPLARGALVLAVAALVVVSLAPLSAIALMAFAALGVGTSVIYPLTLSAAARVGGPRASQNVATVTMVGAILVLAAPAVLGYIATAFGIRVVFVAIVPIILISLAASGILGKSRPQ
jgi:MFS family permease